MGEKGWPVGGGYEVQLMSVLGPGSPPPTAPPQPAACGGGVLWVYCGKLDVTGADSCPYEPHEVCLALLLPVAASELIQCGAIPGVP